MNQVQSHTVHPIAERTYRICEEGFVNSYLVLGNTGVLLIDTGNGSGNIFEVVSGLTDLPMTVIATHAHGDHLGGAGWFDEVLIHEADMAPVYEGSRGEFASRVAAKMNSAPYHCTKKPHKEHLKPIALPYSLGWAAGGWRPFRCPVILQVPSVCSIGKTVCFSAVMRRVQSCS